MKRLLEKEGITQKDFDLIDTTQKCDANTLITIIVRIRQLRKTARGVSIKCAGAVVGKVGESSQALRNQVQCIWFCQHQARVIRMVLDFCYKDAELSKMLASSRMQLSEEQLLLRFSYPHAHNSEPLLVLGEIVRLYANSTGLGPEIAYFNMLLVKKKISLSNLWMHIHFCDQKRLKSGSTSTERLMTKLIKNDVGMPLKRIKNYARVRNGYQ
ncbi:unnamed protein product [Cylicocyclus nassatus]|uniref:Uncharacterized protein n=1 Tax=Cylicocyclus nassatus TaxID=53992 RepID=A0AA36GXI4_CYLNA|nr:unnamed protein product [Cylicocyclus nassatus]